MHCVTILFTQKDMSQSHDNKINVSTNQNNSRDFFHVRYDSPEYTFSKTFMSSFSGVISYIEDTLASMRYDTEPFEHIQINTTIHPPVMFHVSDLDDCEIRSLIVNMVSDSMRFGITSSTK